MTLFFLFVFNVLDDNQLELQQQQFESAECGWSNMSSSIDQSVATYSNCKYAKWTGELKKTVKITKISFICLKHHNNIPKVSVRMKGQQKSQICTNEKEKTANFFKFNCHGHRSDTVEIDLDGELFDVKAYCEFKVFLQFKFQ